MTAELLRIGVEGVVPVRWDLTSSKDASDGPGVLAGYASVFNVVDDQDEVVAPGAFKNTIARWKQAGRRLPLMSGHSVRNEDIIGSFDVLKEDEVGLAVRARFSSDPDSQRLRTKAMEGHLNGMSIFGEVKRFSTRTIGEKTIRIIEEAHLMHIALTSIPALMIAGGVAKDLAGLAKAALLPEQWIEDMRAALAIKNADVRNAAVAALVAGQFVITKQEDASDAGKDGEPDPDAGVSKDDASAYALALIGESGPGTDPPGGDPSDSVTDRIIKQVDTASAMSEIDNLLEELGGNGNA